MKRKREGLQPLAFHGVTLRSREPEALARRCRDLLGWKVLRRGSRELILGEGPELFVAIRPVGREGPEGVEEIHLAVKGVRKAGRRVHSDPLGGDSWTRPLTDALSLTLREFRRAPSPKWRKKRKKV